MTEYDSEPIAVDDMRNGDLITRELFPLPEGSRFVGRNPITKDGIIAASARFGPLSYDAGGWTWHKLEPKPDPVLCKHCGDEIHRVDLGWWHAGSRSSTCRPRQATPATESETA